MPDLLDPMVCGEDLAQNAARFSALAPQHCSGCADYHIRSAVHRCAGPPKSVFDRPELIKLIRGIVADSAARGEQPIEIVIAGAADTAVLATAAHAASTLGASVLRRCRFTVLDRCRTPLLVCEEFAARHSLDLHVEQVDLLAASKPCTADLIVVHSVFRFIPRADQADLLRRLASWLGPEGRLIFSTRILLDDARGEAGDEIRKRKAANRAAADALAKGLLRLAEPADVTLGRLERAIADGDGRPGELHGLDDVRALVREAGLDQHSMQSLRWEFAIGPDAVMQRKRAVAVLGRRED